MWMIDRYRPQCVIYNRREAQWPCSQMGPKSAFRCTLLLSRLATSMILEHIRTNS